MAGFSLNGGGWEQADDVNDVNDVALLYAIRRFRFELTSFSPAIPVRNSGR
jgi:hypothetical protein